MQDIAKDALHQFLVTHFDLVVDPVERGQACTYFLGHVVWHPSTTTRILHVQYGDDDAVRHIRLCVSSDNNNSVVMRAPISLQDLRQAVADEIARHTSRTMHGVSR